MAIILLSILFCLTLSFVPEAPTLLAGIETDAAILSVAVLTIIIFRVWLRARDASGGTDDISHYRRDRRRWMSRR